MFILAAKTNVPLRAIFELPMNGNLGNFNIITFRTENGVPVGPEHTGPDQTIPKDEVQTDAVFLHQIFVDPAPAHPVKMTIRYTQDGQPVTITNEETGDAVEAIEVKISGPSARAQVVIA